MSLTAALRSATSSLRALQTQTAIASTNIANAQTPGATRKYANVVTNSTGGVEVVSIGQATSSSVFNGVLTATASTAQWSAVTDGLDQLVSTIGDTTDATSPAARINALQNALTNLSATPGSYDLARAASAAAKDLASGLNQASATVQTVRQTADKQISDAAADMNTLLAKIEVLNKQVISGTSTNGDVTDAVDSRNQAIQQLSEYVSVTVRTRANNDVVLYTDSGVTLFETTPRAVSYDGNSKIDASVTEGPALMVDGTPVTGKNALQPLISGKVAGLVDLRDHVATTYQTQLDEVARALVVAFSESDQSATPTLEDKTGLFGNGSVVAPTPVALGTLNVGGTAATTIAAGDQLNFKFSYGDTAYAASHVFTSAEATALSSGTAATRATAYQTILQSTVNGAIGADGTLFGGGKITANVGAVSGAITLTPEGAGVYKTFSVSDVTGRTTDAGKTGGLTAASTTGTTATSSVRASALATGDGATVGAVVDAGNFSSLSLLTGNTVSFSLKYNGTTTAISGSIGVPVPTTAAGYVAALQGLIDGSAIGAGNITVSADGTGEISLTTTGFTDTLQAIAAVPAAGSATGTGSGTGSTAASIDAGSFSGASLKDGDTLSFNLTLNGKSYKVSGLLNPVPTTAASYVTTLQGLIDNSVSIADGTTLGPSKIVVSADSVTGEIGIATSATGPTQSLKVSNTVVDSPVPVTVATYTAGTIAVGDVLTFDLSVSGTTYKVSHTFSGVPADADAYALVLQNAVNSAIAVPAGTVLGSGKVAISNSAGTISAKTVAGGTAAGLAVSNVTASLGTQDPNKTGGLTSGAAVSVFNGLAGTLTFADSATTNPLLLRDGGINGAAYKSNTANAGGFNGRINDLLDALGQQRSFSSTSQADPTGTLANFAASSVSWLQGTRTDAKGQVDYQSTLLASMQKTLSSDTGVSMDDELTQLIQLQRSYQASSKIVSTVDQMLQSLMQAIG